MPEQAHPALGAFPHPDGTTTFRVWAPAAASVAVECRGSQGALTPATSGTHEGRIDATAGDEYRFILDGGERRPDPCSRDQPEGISGPSRVLDTAALRAGERPAAPHVALADLVIYELHVGTFSEAGTFDAAIPRLAGLRDLGVTAIEVMPVATFDGRRGWGYDSLYTFAPHPAYGGPAALSRLVDAAHAAGLAVILDVVYNHLGAGSDAVEAFGRYTTDRHRTLWGDAIDYAQPAVREWAIQNAEMWVRDYAVDGLRLDAVNAIEDDREPHVMAELAGRVKAINPSALVISETRIGDRRPIERWGHDAQWDDSLHHAVHVLLTGEHDGYYARFGTIADLARALEEPQGRRLVVCAQNHDQVGNRPLGDRLRGRDLRLAVFCALLSPGTPLLFQGEEYDEPHPFLYFADHSDPLIARLTRQGRREEFADFPGFTADAVPDPLDPATFERSKLDPSRGDPEHLAYYRELLRLRRDLPPGPGHVHVDEDRRMLHVLRGEVELVANFALVGQDGVPARSGVVRARRSARG